METEATAPPPEPPPAAPEPEPAPAPSTAVADAAARKWVVRRRLGFLILIVFAGVGFWLFGQRMTRDAVLRVEVAPTVFSGSLAIPRAQLVRLGGVVRNEEHTIVATFDVPLPAGLASPLSPPVALHLARGHYLVSVVAEGPAGVKAPLEGAFDIDGDGETRASLRGAAAR